MCKPGQPPCGSAEAYAEIGAFAAAVRSDLRPTAVLGVETYVIPPNDANGNAVAVTRSFTVPYASVAVNVVGTGVVTVTNATNGQVPSSGPGVAKQGPGKGGVFNLSGHSISVYGTVPGDSVTLQFFTRPQPPTWG